MGGRRRGKKMHGGVTGGGKKKMVVVEEGHDVLVRLLLNDHLESAANILKKVFRKDGPPLGLQFDPLPPLAFSKDVRDMRLDHVTYQQKACQSQPQVGRSNEVYTSFVGDGSCIAKIVRSRKSQKAVMSWQMKKKRSRAEEETDTNIPLRASKKLKHKPIKILLRKGSSSAAIGGKGEGTLPKLTSPVRIDLDASSVEDSPVQGAQEADHPCQPIQAQERTEKICNQDPPMMMDAPSTPERNGPEAPVLPDFQEATQVQASNQPQPSPRKSEAERQKDQRDSSSTSEGREIRQENVQKLLLLSSETNKFQDSVLPEAPVLPDFQEAMQVQASNQPHPSPSKFEADRQKDQTDASHTSQRREIREEMVQKLLSSEKNELQDSMLPGASSLGNSSCNVVAPIIEMTPAESFSLTSSTMDWASTFDDVSSTTHAGYWGTDGKMVKVGNYFVEQKHSSTMEAIIKKYGDIAKDFQNSSTMFRSYAVRGVCEVVVGLQIPLRHLNHERFDKYMCFVKEAAEMGLSVKWLEERFAEVSETIESLKRCKCIKESQRQNMGKMEHLKEKIGLVEIEKMKGENEVESLKCLLEAARLEVRKKKSAINDLKSRCKAIPKRLLDGLY